MAAANQNFRIKVRYSSSFAASAGSSASPGRIDLRLGDAIASGLDRLADRIKIDLLRLVFDVDGIWTEVCSRRNDARCHLQRQLDANDARAAVHVLDRDARGSRADGVADRPDCPQDVRNFRALRIVNDSCYLVDKIDLRGSHTGD